MSEEERLNASGTNTLPDDYYSILVPDAFSRPSSDNVFYDYEDQQGIENIQLKMRSTVCLEAQQAPEYKTQHGIEDIQSKIRSTVFSEALQAPDHENQDIEYIESRIKSTVFHQDLQDGYENEQGIHNIQTAMRSTESFEALQAPKYMNQQGIEDIHATVRSANFFEALRAPEHEDNQESEPIQANQMITEHDTQETKFENQEEMVKQRDRDQLSFLHDVLEVVEFEKQHWIDNMFGKKVPITRPRLHSIVQQHGFDNIDTVLQEGMDKLNPVKSLYKVMRLAPLGKESKALELRLRDAIKNFRVIVFQDYLNQSGNKHIQASMEEYVSVWFTPIRRRSFDLASFMRSKQSEGKTRIGS